ncbi:C4-dicarboxylate transporter DctQ subunit [Clostridiales Family XIII bacterium PM5-7]
MQKKKNSWYNNIEGNISVIIIIAMLIILTVQVVGRYVTGTSWGWIDEISRYGLIWLAYLAAVYAIYKEAHIKVDILLKVWPKRIRKGIKHLSTIIFFVYCLVVAYYSAIWVSDIISTGTVSVSMQLNMWYFQCIVPLAHILMAIRLLQVEIRHIKHPELLDDRADEEFEKIMEVAKEGEDN